MNSISIQPVNERAALKRFVAWLVTFLILTAGFQRVKEIIEYILLKLYEFIIQRNAINI
ncbi:MAG: hypothetical protein JST10_11845 [Bacteroidetes bacterium]|nr:hypothetical protein [Bacteroidota bacterium]